MEVLQVVGIVLMGIGILGVGYGLIAFRMGKPETGEDYLERSILSQVGNKAGEIDKTVDEFDKMSGEVFTHLESKYNELLFLYSLIDDKKSEMAGLRTAEPEIEKKLTEFNELSKQGGGKKFRNARHDEIKGLIDNGMSVADAAKKLNIGQGEVRLILELGKISG